MTRRMYQYSATVRGAARSVIFHADPEEWGHEPIVEDDGTVTPAELNLPTAELLIDNDRAAYEEFWTGAEYDDYDAPREGATLRVHIPATWQTVEVDGE